MLARIGIVCFLDPRDSEPLVYLGGFIVGNRNRTGKPEVIRLRRKAAPAHLTLELNMPGILGGRR